jgi:hypothetical protein
MFLTVQGISQAAGAIRTYCRSFFAAALQSIVAAQICARTASRQGAANAAFAGVASARVQATVTHGIPFATALSGLAHEGGALLKRRSFCHAIGVAPGDCERRTATGDGNGGL